MMAPFQTNSVGLRDTYRMVLKVWSSGALESLVWNGPEVLPEIVQYYLVRDFLHSLVRIS